MESMDYFAQLFGREIPEVTAQNALAGRESAVLPVARPHTVLGTPIDAAPAPGEEEIFLALGCFWGAEKLFWELGASTTAVGYMGGFTPNPTYEEACTGMTGHTETVRVVFDPARLPLAEILRAFFESHDPTTLNRQGGDVGTQYRSAIFTTTPEQYAEAIRIRDLYQGALDSAGHGAIVTEVVAPGEGGGNGRSAEFFYAEDYHQQYLDKNPNGYQCHARTGVACPMA